LIFIDTGPIVAFFDKDDRYHGLCIENLKDIREPLVTTWSVLTECFYLLNFSWEVQDSLWLFMQRGGVEIYPLEKELLNRCRELMKQYRKPAHGFGRRCLSGACRCPGGPQNIYP